MIIVVGLLTEHHDAGFGAKHDWNANEHNYDQSLRDLFLAMKEENIC